MLNPFNLIYFIEQVYQKDFIEEREIANFSVIFYDLLLTFACGFTNDIHSLAAQELIKAAKSQLNIVLQYINSMEPE